MTQSLCFSLRYLALLREIELAIGGKAQETRYKEQEPRSREPRSQQTATKPTHHTVALLPGSGN